MDKYNNLSGTGSTRIVGQQPFSNINNDDMLYTNVFVSETNKNDISQEQNLNFRYYYEKKKRDKEKQSLINKSSYDDNVYSPFAEVSLSQLGVEKVNVDKPKTIITEISEIIDINSKKRDKFLYPNPNDFKIFLGKTYYNVKKLRLVSTEIPNTDQVIRNQPEEIKNNLISWENKEDFDLGIKRNVTIMTVIPDTVDILYTSHNLENKVYNGDLYVEISNSTTVPNIDGQRYVEVVNKNTLRFPFIGGITTGTAVIDIGIPNYTVELRPGNYSAITLASEIQNSMNSIKRRAGNGIFHYFEVKVNMDTDILSFHSVILTQLLTNPLATTINSNIITVTQHGHGFKTGDLVLITGARKIGGIETDFLNGNFIVTVIDFNTFHYEVQDRATESSDGGGPVVKTGKPAPFRLIFNTAKSIIVDNIGFPVEDSSEPLTSDNSITTKALSINDITLLGNNKVRFTTTENHLLEEATIRNIVDITSGLNPIVTLDAPHLLGLTNNVKITGTNTKPKLNGVYRVKEISPNQFIINNLLLYEGGNEGKVKYNGDRINIIGLETIPSIQPDTSFVVENITNDTFEIDSPIYYVNKDILDKTVIGTTQITVNHPLHKFNEIVSISPIGTTHALITTKIPHNLVGTVYELVEIETIIDNTIDIFITNHGLETSDLITISNSTSNPTIDNDYYIQVIDQDIIRINYIGGINFSATATVATGEKVVITKTNSIPKISINGDGNMAYNINVIDPLSFQIETKFEITQIGTYGILGRKNEISLYRVEPEILNGNNVAGINLNFINNHYRNIERIIDNNSYMIRIPDAFAAKTITAGGSNTYISSEKNGFRDFQYNTTTGTSSGKLFKSITLEGEDYILLVSPGLKSIVTAGNISIDDVFAKIILSEPAGNKMYNTFVSVPTILTTPLSKLDTLHFQVKRQDGFLFNFNDIDYSFSLEITTIQEQLANNLLNSKSGNNDFGFGNLSTVKKN